jgi:hypothetical protein
MEDFIEQSRLSMHHDDKPTKTSNTMELLDREKSPKKCQTENLVEDFSPTYKIYIAANNSTSVASDREPSTKTKPKPTI